MAEVMSRKTMALGTSLVVAFGAMATGCGEGKPGYCLSKRAYNAMYPGDPKANPNDQETWHEGIEIATTLPPDAKGLLVGYAGLDKSYWSDSDPVSPDRAARTVVKIGHGAVIFSTRLEAAAGSAACDQQPDSTFSSPGSFDQIYNSGATATHWPKK